MLFNVNRQIKRFFLFCFFMGGVLPLNVKTTLLHADSTEATSVLLAFLDSPPVWL